HIFRLFSNRYDQMSLALAYCLSSTKDSFDVKHFIDSFRSEPGLRRSLDKIYEIIVFSLFSTLIEALNLKVEISIDDQTIDILKDFEDFAKKVMSIDATNTSHIQAARVYRVGVTNAADRGLDMYSNWGPAIQIKHLCLDENLAENIVSDVSSDRIVIVCKSADKKIILSLLTQIGWKAKIQSVITESDLIRWYEKALHGKYSETMGSRLVETLSNEIAGEFPSTVGIPEILSSRSYHTISDDFWR
ncbi:MAG: HaeII family restriction endonuclease, partial [Limnochordia bacterium]|nr:HaeII family restriction endonuclease [Limnochordia bacterium]